MSSVKEDGGVAAHATAAQAYPKRDYIFFSFNYITGDQYVRNTCEFTASVLRRGLCAL